MTAKHLELNHAVKNDLKLAERCKKGRQHGSTAFYGFLRNHFYYNSSSAEANICRKSAMKILNNFTGCFSGTPIFDFA